LAGPEAAEVLGETTVVLAHQGGWDEMLFVLVPLLVFLTLQWLNRRKTRQETDDAEGPKSQ
jgi:hypothetical protein